MAHVPVNSTGSLPSLPAESVHENVPMTTQADLQLGVLAAQLDVSGSLAPPTTAPPATGTTPVVEGSAFDILGKRPAGSDFADDSLARSEAAHQRLQQAKNEQSKLTTTPAIIRGTALSSLSTTFQRPSAAARLSQAPNEDSELTGHPFVGPFRHEHNRIPGVEQVLISESNDANYRSKLFTRSRKVLDFAKLGFPECAYVVLLALLTLLGLLLSMISDPEQRAILEDAISRIEFLLDMALGQWQHEPWSVGVARVEVEARRLQGIPVTPSDFIHQMAAAFRAQSTPSGPSNRRPQYGRPRAASHSQPPRTMGAICNYCGKRNHTAAQCEQKKRAEQNAK
eukprot:Colp12_sorted_trinity150504_noHs@7031